MYCSEARIGARHTVRSILPPKFQHEGLLGIFTRGVIGASRALLEVGTRLHYCKRRPGNDH